MQNQTLIQYFHWYYNEPDHLWVKAAKEAENLQKMGFTIVWFPPAYKGSTGGYSIGYDAYDLFDLGEFDQKGSIPTKYGSKQEYIDAIKALQKQGIKVLADTIFNHKAGGDELEKIKVRKVNAENREEFISDIFEIEAWTKFTFPGRNGKHSEFIWDHTCFSGVDWAEDIKESAIYAIQNEHDESWEKVASTEFGNYDYLMYDDIDFRNKEVKEELKRWGKWFCETCNIDGFRLDAVKHISPDFFNEWIDSMKACNNDLLMIAENWNVEDANQLEKYIETTGGRTQLFDSLLHHNLYLASTAGKDFDLSKLFENTLIQKNPMMAITFVDNHDSQPMQALESYIDFWFRPLAYAIILLREQGIPCVFYPDMYGAKYEESGEHVELVALGELPQLMEARTRLAYGLQRDYFDHQNCVGWTREGDEQHENSGLAVLLSNGEDGFKQMEIGRKFTGKIFVDTLGKRSEEIIIDENGFGEFLCNAGSVSVWGMKHALN